MARPATNSCALSAIRRSAEVHHADLVATHAVTKREVLQINIGPRASCRSFHDVETCPWTDTSTRSARRDRTPLGGQRACDECAGALPPEKLVLELGNVGAPSQPDGAEQLVDNALRILARNSLPARGALAEPVLGAWARRRCPAPSSVVELAYEVLRSSSSGAGRVGRSPPWDPLPRCREDSPRPARHVEPREQAATGSCAPDSPTGRGRPAMMGESMSSTACTNCRAFRSRSPVQPSRGPRRGLGAALRPRRAACRDSLRDGNGAHAGRAFSSRACTQHAHGCGPRRGGRTLGMQRRRPWTVACCF
jgi:hypothetical protein